MDPEEQTSGLYDIIQGIVHVEWLSTALTVAIALAFTALVARAVTKVLRRVLSHDNSPLPSSSIFVNIARIAVWAVGVSVVLSSCFGIDVSAAITALGIGGIAISLGFQDTLSNLIGGVQVSITGLVEPGDYIEVGGRARCDVAPHLARDAFGRARRGAELGDQQVVAHASAAAYEGGGAPACHHGWRRP